MSAVADPTDVHHRRERRSQPVALSDGPDHGAGKHGGIGGSHGIARGERELELRRCVLRMELCHREARRLEGVVQRPEIVGELDHARQSIGRPRRRGHEVVLTGEADDPLEFDPHRRAGTRIGEQGNLALERRASAELVGSAVAAEAVHRRKGPSIERRERPQEPGVGTEPEVVHRATAHARGGDGVVGEKGVEDRAHADTGVARHGEALGRNRLHPCDPGKVHVDQRHLASVTERRNVAPRAVLQIALCSLLRLVDDHHASFWPMRLRT